MSLMLPTLSAMENGPQNEFAESVWKILLNNSKSQQLGITNKMKNTKPYNYLHHKLSVTLLVMNSYDKQSHKTK